jgi:hypothetical protein
METYEGTSLRWVVRFTPRPLYLREMKIWYILDRRLGGPQIRTWQQGEEKFWPHRDSKWGPMLDLPLASLHRLRYTGFEQSMWAIQNPNIAILFLLSLDNSIAINCRRNCQAIIRDARTSVGIAVSTSSESKSRLLLVCKLGGTGIVTEYESASICELISDSRSWRCKLCTSKFPSICFVRGHSEKYVATSYSEWR